MIDPKEDIRVVACSFPCWRETTLSAEGGMIDRLEISTNRDCLGADRIPIVTLVNFKVGRHCCFSMDASVLFEALRRFGLSDPIALEKEKL